MIPNPKPKGRDASSRALKICDLGLRESEVHTVSGPVTTLPTVTFKRLRTRHPALHVRKSIILKTSLLPQPVHHLPVTTCYNHMPKESLVALYCPFKHLPPLLKALHLIKPCNNPNAPDKSLRIQGEPPSHIVIPDIETLHSTV